MKKDQGEVWSKVAETTAKNQANTSTGTLTALKDAEAFNKDLKKYTDHFHPLLSNESEVIGVIAVSGDVIMGCDMFASHEIFATYLPNLLSSYATEAITSGGPSTVSHERVTAYLRTIIEDETKQENNVKERGTMLQDGNKKIHISTF